MPGIPIMVVMIKTPGGWRSMRLFFLFGEVVKCPKTLDQVYYSNVYCSTTYFG
jgi:hypothetical protein